MPPSSSTKPPSSKKHPPKKHPPKNKVTANASTGKPKNVTRLSQNVDTTITPAKQSAAVHQRGDFQRPPATLIVLWIMVSAKLILDLVTTIIAFISATKEFDCCGESIDMKGSLVLGFTIPFFLLILLELGVLAVTIKQGLFGEIQETVHDNDGPFAFLGDNRKQQFVNGLLLFNPFFGFFMAWMLLYQSSRRECLAVLGIEAVSLVLHYVTIYLEGHKQTRLSLAIYSLPIIPFVVTVIAIVVYMQRGGVCFLADDEMFWYEGCQVCPDDTLPDEDTGLCSDGNKTVYGTYCSNDMSFCWFSYT